jgi:hypothetical protein
VHMDISTSRSLQVQNIQMDAEIPQMVFLRTEKGVM